MNKYDLWTRLNWMDRKEIVAILEGYLCMQCYDYESTDFLREVVINNIKSGELEESVLEANHG